ncbi:hypothetical protein FF124_09420 [Martelella lutilitoris]|uniref:Uncharacterized protein n=1 Tax=Martelella lutilitoris TaxID=2583532 RepID=A0A5C4JQR1_9HYPH|nr:DUF6544 family protein [Martelella lutilitoris]TNB47805.1 hypothetical protein FF124_09420 [Martelella lutilitoris]
MIIRILKYAAAGLAVIIVALIVWIGISYVVTLREIAGHVRSVRAIAAEDQFPRPSAAQIQALPAPVKRYFDFAIKEVDPSLTVVSVAEEGMFRRPLTEGFGPTQAEQTISLSSPALLFTATTPIAPGIDARVYDYFAGGEMEMRAKLASTLTVVDEKATPELNRISLRRWLLESPLFPVALLPGGPVRWEPIDEHSALATVSGFGLEASMIATFRDDGSLASFDATEDGDLTTPYHGSGEHSERGDYRLVAGMMIPHTFLIARAGDGRVEPFWKGRVTGISFE